MRRPFALTHVSIVGVERENVFHDNTVDVSGTRIAAAGARVRILTGTRAITARSKVLIPGLRDLHSHSPDQWEWSSRLNMANGVTSVRGAGAVGATRDIVELRRAVERGRTFGPRFVASGTFTHGLPKSRATYVAIDSPQEMRAEVRQRTRTALALHECVYSTLPRRIPGGRSQMQAPRHTTHRACAARDHGGQGVGCGKAE